MRTSIIIAIMLLIKLLNANAQQIQPFNFLPSQYDFVDTIYFGSTKGDCVIIGFQKKECESLIIYNYKGKNVYYPEKVLTCHYCQGKGISASTYKGYVKKGRAITFIQEVFGRTDSIVVDFSKEIPAYRRIVADFGQKDKADNSIYWGVYTLTPKEYLPFNVWLGDAPVDIADPETKKHFYIKHK